MRRLYEDSDWERAQSVQEKDDIPDEPYRKPWRRDYARVLHSPSFRRLQGKTQLFPGAESDYFRNRLTHSLEVAQIAKSIAVRLNHTDEYLRDTNQEIKYDVCETAGLAHDLGHPPFGHYGERALDRMMSSSGGFEGNAQTLRILSRIEKRENNFGEASREKSLREHRVGLNLTYRTLASVLKYDEEIPCSVPFARTKPQKGYFQSEREVVQQIKANVCGGSSPSDFQTVECRIMELADDIAYSTYDLEDALKAGFTTPLDIVSISDERVDEIIGELSMKLSRQEVRDTLFRVFGGVVSSDQLAPRNAPFIQRLTAANNASKSLASDGYLRTPFTSYLVSWFMTSIVLRPNEECPPLSVPTLPDDVRQVVEVLKKFAYVTFINSPQLRTAEQRGSEIVSKVFEAIHESTRSTANLLPDDFRSLYRTIPQDQKDRIVCDFVAGMTDRYALEFYGRLYSENPQTIFKPL